MVDFDGVTDHGRDLLVVFIFYRFAFCLFTCVLKSLTKVL